MILKAYGLKLHFYIRTLLTNAAVFSNYCKKEPYMGVKKIRNVIYVTVVFFSSEKLHFILFWNYVFCLFAFWEEKINNETIYHECFLVGFIQISIKEISKYGLKILHLVGVAYIYMLGEQYGQKIHRYT